MQIKNPLDVVIEYAVSASKINSPRYIFAGRVVPTYASLFIYQLLSKQGWRVPQHGFHSCSSSH